MEKTKGKLLREAQSAVFSQRLQQALIMRGMNHRELAKAVEAPYSAVWNWLNGYRLPQAQILCIVADVLDVSVDWLLGRTVQAGMTYHGRLEP